MSNHERHLCEACLKEEYEAFSHDCIHESMAQNKLWLEKYKINDWPRWDYSMDDATLTFSSDGVSKVLCEMQVVGSAQGDSWEWSWGNKCMPDACKTQMHLVREFGEEKQYENLSQLFLDYNQYRGWECASVASHLLGGEAVYRCPNKTGAVYLVIMSSQFAL